MSARAEILYVVSSSAIGGAEVMALASARDLRDRYGFGIAFVAGGGPYADRIRADGFPVVEIPLRDNADAVGFTRLLLHLRRTRPDLVHLHMNRAGLLGGIACNLLGIPSVATAAGMVHRRYVDRAGLILPCSEAVRDHLLAQGVPASSLRLLINAIDPSSNAPSSGASPRGGARILMVARLHPNKGHRDLLEAFAMLAPAHPRAFVDLVGGGPRAFEAELRARARMLGVAGRVRFRGEVTDPRPLLYGADLFALPSYVEGLPLTVLEAMDAGLPVVAYDIPGLRGIAPPEEGGPRLVPLRDIPRLAGALDQYLRHPCLRRRAGAAARETVARRFSLERYGDELAALYREYFKMMKKREAS